MKNLYKAAAVSLAALMAAAALASCGNKEQSNSTPAPTENVSEAPTENVSEAPTGEVSASPEHTHDHDEDPQKISIGRVGVKEFTMADYLNVYQTYAPYAMYIPNVDELVRKQLVEMGVILTRCDKLGIALDEQDENDVERQFEEHLDELFTMAVEYGMASEADKDNAEARLSAIEALLEEYDFTFESYRSSVIEDMRSTKLYEKLRAITDAEVEFSEAQLREYYNTNLQKDKESYENSAEAFSSAYTAYITGEGRIPLYTPKDVFAVKHLLVQYENFDEVSEENPGVFGDEQNKKLDEIRAALEAGISLEDFVNNYVSNKAYNDDTVLTVSEDGGQDAFSEAYRNHGYVMHETLVSRYFEGFGAAACVLYYGEDWELKTESPVEGGTPAPVSENAVQKYDIKLHTTTDGQKIAEVRSNSIGGGIHFIYINERLPEGEAKLDMGSESDPVYSSVMEHGKKEAEDQHFSECLVEWEKETSVELDDELIAHYMSEDLGVG